MATTGLYVIVYFMIIYVHEAGTGVILPSNHQVGEVPFKALHGVHRDVLPVAEAASQNNFRPIANGAGVTLKGIMV